MLDFAVLAAALLSLWGGRDPQTDARARFGWLVVFAGWLFAAFASGRVTLAALPAIAALAAAAWAWAFGARRGWVRWAAGIGVVVTAGAFMSHVLPGFHNVRIWSGVVLSDGALPFNLYLNADKPLVGLFLIGWCHPRLGRRTEWRAMLAAAAPVAGATIALLIAVSWGLGYVRPDLKLPEQAWLWLGVNLLFTCVAEEALFRGWVQAGLAGRWRGRREGAAAAIGLAAALFGLAHVGGGWTYVALATVAGVGYGTVYHRTGRIEAAILTHFLLNTVHFLGFTYPALAPV